MFFVAWREKTTNFPLAQRHSARISLVIFALPLVKSVNKTRIFQTMAKIVGCSKVVVAMIYINTILARNALSELNGIARRTQRK
jgi:hypothetical protein